MKKLIIIMLTVLLTAGVNSSSVMAVGAGRGIGTEQSCHNFSHESWLPIYKICRTCHIPHGKRGHTAAQRYVKGLPWNSKIHSITYNIYDSVWSTSISGVRDPSWTSPITRKQSGMPDGLSKLCLGCHDSVIATDVFNLHHFISMEYDITKAELRDPNLTKIGLSGPISEVLEVGKVQCSSCHDVHDEESVPNTKLLRVDKNELCTTCHKK